MFAKPPLLTIQQGSKGTFVSWLEDLGLKDFLKNHPLSKLEEWGWLVPQHRVVFPVGYFLAWQNFPLCPAEIDSTKPAFDTEDCLWASEWCVEKDQSPLWFLHPFFQATASSYDLLRKNNYRTTPIPDAFVHPYRSISITPYADYFFHWQAYALIDVVCRADYFQPILNTPDIEERAESVIRYATQLKQNDIKPTDVLSESNHWGGLAEPMTWLSHYRAFRDALCGNDDQNLQIKGAKQLAEHLGINAEILEEAIETKLLRLAQRWLWANEKHSKWTLQAWPYLQKDIRLALEWLYILNDNDLAFYLDKWAYSSFGEREWAELSRVLPYEFFEDKRYFLRYLPFYKKHYEYVLPTDQILKNLVDRLQSANYLFGSFLNAFRQLHENLERNPKQKSNLEFRTLRPLDYYSLLAIRAESCLRYALGYDREENISEENDKKGLTDYIRELARQRNISDSVVDYFEQKINDNRRKYTKAGQYTQPKKSNDPIGEIMNIECADERSNCLLKAFLSCLLARNYFAHHTYLDKELIRTEKSAFMLTGILTTVLVLLDDSVDYS
ncbi:hypothetical protein JWZ98_06280 [Methylomonas sp. EFPC1]|uniref:hypothetical protein n=1 Tax=unclassified Methylomonas TaxID=2608980 RepID=UPI00051B6473|nr:MULTISPECIES: hypothetical protein [unclassified Methylomonas]QBC26687.1 hypothetical protein U737_07055 [Methylomonas sp. LW13]QSB02547.1 hypothetical protein JWZ98_06280 [Methylomonas sp. EFPC1]